MSLLTTPLHSRTSSLSSMMEFQGWSLPRSFSSIEREVLSARTGAAVMDSSPWGRILLRGRDGLDLLHRLSTNDLREIPAGRAVPTILTTEKGRIVDAFDVFRNPTGHLLLTSIGSEGEILQWIGKFTIMEEIELEVVTFSTAQLTLIGPEAHRVLEALSGRGDPPEPQVVAVTRGTLPLTCLIVPSGDGVRLWDLLVEAGANPLGMDGWEVLRIMHGIPERPFELRKDFNPYDVALRDSISYTKGCYVGQEVIARLDTYQKARRALAGVRSPAFPVGIGSTLLSESGEEAGTVTSQAPVPFAGQWLGMAVVRSDLLPAGTEAPVEGIGKKVFIEAFPISISPSA